MRPVFLFPNRFRRRLSFPAERPRSTPKCPQHPTRAGPPSFQMRRDDGRASACGFRAAPPATNRRRETQVSLAPAHSRQGAGGAHGPQDRIDTSASQANRSGPASAGDLGKGHAHMKQSARADSMRRRHARDYVLERPELLRPTSPRAPTPGQAKFPIKVNPYEGLIAEARAARALCAEGLGFVDEQHARKR